MKKLLAALLILLMIPFAACAEIAPYEYCVGPDGAYYENYTYPADVIISGENTQIMFVHCRFEGNVILTAAEGTRVLLLGCETMGECILQNDVRDADMDYSNPKFITDTPLNVVCNDCAGTVAAIGVFELTFNGQTYGLEDAQIFIDETGGMGPYEGQEATNLIVAMMHENGQPTVSILAEYAPEE